MKKSKYLGMKNGNWECTHAGVDRVQPAFTHFRNYEGKRIRSKNAGHQSYYYIFERLTSDAKAMKMIRLSAAQVAKVYRGQATVEEFAIKKERARSQEFTKKVSYSFCE